MYAIVKSGGKQYRVEQGQRLLVERLPASEGEDLTLEPIFYRSDELVFDRAGLDGVTVTAKVLAHVRGEKLRVFKFKPKRGYRRRTGHRQDLTQIEVTQIAHGKAKAAAKPAAAKPPKEPAAKASAARAAAAKAGAEEPKAADARAAEPASAKPAAKARPAKPSGAKASAKPAGAKPASKAKEKPKDGS